MTLPREVTETEVLETAMLECLRKLREYRDEGDDLAVDLAQADLNQMIERHAHLAAK